MTLVLMSKDLRPRILVAEDDAQLNRLVVTWLKRADLEVDSVFDGEQAIEAMKARDYAVILLDMMMPRVTGFDVIEYAAEHQPKLLENIIVMTAAGESVSERIKGHAVYRMIAKPFDLRELLDCALDCAKTRSTAQISFNRSASAEVNVAHRALVVDDDEATRYLLARPFVGKFEIEYASNGYEAIEALKKKDFDVVLLDLKMPGIDGLGVIRYLEEHQRHVLEKVVLVTIAPEDVSRAGVSVGGVMPKPVDGEELASYVNAHILRGQERAARERND